MPHPRSVRFDAAVADRLARFVVRHPEVSGSAAVNRFVDEGLRMEEHPGVIFRSGPAGRRAVLVGGHDIWEVIRAVRDARSAEPGPEGDRVLELVETSTGVPLRMIRTALAYWAAYPEDVDAAVSDGDLAEQAEVERRHRTDALLAP